MNDSAAQAFARLTVSYERLHRAIKDCDAAREGKDTAHPVVAAAEQMTLDAQVFDLDYIINQTMAICLLANNRAKQIEAVTKSIKEVTQ